MAKIEIIILITAVMFVSKSSHIITEITTFNADIKIKKTFLLLTAININIIEENVGEKITYKDIEEINKNKFAK